MLRIENELFYLSTFDKTFKFPIKGFNEVIIKWENDSDLMWFDPTPKTDINLTLAGLDILCINCGRKDLYGQLGWQPSLEKIIIKVKVAKWWCRYNKYIKAKDTYICFNPMIIIEDSEKISFPKCDYASDVHNCSRLKFIEEKLKKE